jgi:hypothetical protein
MFKSHPHQPEAFLTLDPSSQRAHLAGSPIIGHVTITSPIQRNLLTAKILLFGRAMTHSAKMEAINGEAVTLDFGDDSCLFRINELLAQNQNVLPNQPLNLDFHLRMPERIEAPETANPWAVETRYQGIYKELAHPLPPTFSLIAGPNMWAMVEYNIQAVLQFEGEKDLLTVQLPEPLLVYLRPEGPPPQKPPAEFTKVPEKYASSRLTGNPASKRSSLKDRFSSKVPSVNLVMKAIVPTILTTGRAFVITASVEIDSPSAENILIPTIQLRILNLELRKIIHLRAMRRNLQEAHGGHRARETRAEEVEKLNVQPEAMTAHHQLRENQGGKVWMYEAQFEARVPGSACPSFRTFNISHSYRVVMTVEAEVCGKTFDYEVEVGDVFVSPPQ